MFAACEKMALARSDSPSLLEKRQKKREWLDLPFELCISDTHLPTSICIELVDGVFVNGATSGNSVKLSCPLDVNCEHFEFLVIFD